MSHLRTSARLARLLLAGTLLTALASAPAGANPSSDPSSGAGTDGVDTDYGRMLLVLDSSGSMKEPAAGGTTKIDAAKAALHQVVGALPEGSDVGLRVFGATVFAKSQPGACTDSQLVVPPGTDNRDALDAAVDGYTPYGETPIAYALQQAAKDIGSEGTRSIVLVSDGEATCDPDPCDVAAQLREQGVDLQIDVVGLSVSGQARSQLKCIAARGGGRYYDADAADEITESLTQAAERAVRPYEVDGTPIEGGATSDQATPITAGSFSDEIGPQGSATGERWYRFDRTMDDSSLLAGLVLLSDKGVGGNSISLQISTEDGTTCSTTSMTSGISGSTLFGVGAASDNQAKDDPQSPCVTDDVLFLRVNRALAGTEGDAHYNLRLAEEPPVTDAGQLPAQLDINSQGAGFQQPEVTTAPTPVTGGSSLGDATEITDGAYSGTIVPGETQVFKIHVDWGQQLGAEVVVPAATEALMDSGQTSSFATVQLLNPLGAGVTDQPNGIKNNGFGASINSQVLEAGTLPIRWNNRFSYAAASYLPGDYYVVYSAAPDDGSLEMPFTLRVAVVGEPNGAPTYADGETLQTAADTTTQDDSASAGPSTTPSAGASDEASDGASSGVTTAPDARPAAADTTGTSRVQLAAAGGLGLVALVCAGVGVAFLRRPRR